MSNLYLLTTKKKVGKLNTYPSFNDGYGINYKFQVQLIVTFWSCSKCNILEASDIKL